MLVIAAQAGYLRLEQHHITKFDIGLEKLCIDKKFGKRHNISVEDGSFMGKDSKGLEAM